MERNTFRQPTIKKKKGVVTHVVIVKIMGHTTSRHVHLHDTVDTHTIRSFTFSHSERDSTVESLDTNSRSQAELLHLPRVYLRHYVNIALPGWHQTPASGRRRGHCWHGRPICNSPLGPIRQCNLEARRVLQPEPVWAQRLRVVLPRRRELHP